LVLHINVDDVWRVLRGVDSFCCKNS
jgi:hypothetical protein